MIESCLIFIVSLLSVRTNLGLDEESLSRLEMVSLLCMADKTHSVLHEHMPEKPGTPVQLELFDRYRLNLSRLSNSSVQSSQFEPVILLSYPSEYCFCLKGVLFEVNNPA